LAVVSLVAINSAIDCVKRLLSNSLQHVEWCFKPSSLTFQPKLLKVTFSP